MYYLLLILNDGKHKKYGRSIKYIEIIEQNFSGDHSLGIFLIRVCIKTARFNSYIAIFEQDFGDNHSLDIFL